MAFSADSWADICNQKDTTLFHQKYGDYYVNAILYGANIEVTHTSTLKDWSQASDVKSSLTGTWNNIGKIKVKDDQEFEK